MKTIGIVLDYEIRKRVYLMQVENYPTENELLAMLESVARVYIQTAEGKQYFKKNGKKINLLDLLQLGTAVPDKIYESYGMHYGSDESAGEAIEVNAFTPLIKDKPVMAYFGVYDQDFAIHKNDLKRLLDTVNWSEDYVFRDLHYDGSLVGFGFVSIELIESIDEEFNYDEFIANAAKMSHIESTEDEEIYENQDVRFKMIRLDWWRIRV